ncbi:signal recognition particle subunit SRP19 [Nematocida sp. AWRm78]|nr:signal recognition particle subunit SRP19 [Nematocida sp. AWRm79]KAI5186064.1 signal recognition particle subunit SRP19 [Nematocida sp. AWRm78]
MVEVRIYPIYFNSRIKRSQGRKVPFRNNAKAVTLQQLLKALNQLKIEYTVETKQHPKHSYELCAQFLPSTSKPEEVERLFSTTGGAVKITTDSKRQLIKDIDNLLNGSK